MRHLQWGGAAALVGAWIVACVGSDPDTGGPKADPSVPVGQFNGACTAEGKCIEGLVCTQGVVCLRAEGGASSSSGGSSSGGSSSGGSSSGGSSGTNAACPAPADTMATKIACGANSCNTECCLGSTGTGACDADCAVVDPKRVFKCDSKYQCVNGGEECCLALKPSTVIARNVCPSPVAFVDVLEALCTDGGCDTAAGSGQFKMCRSDGECTPPATCRQIEISNGATKLPFSVCVE